MIKPQNKYAVIMTATENLQIGANAFINSLDFYGNKGFDFYLINDFDDEYFKDAKELNFPLFNIRFNDLGKDLKLSKNKDVRGWKGRFFRWLLAKDIGVEYDAILVVDADMFCLNNIMQYFKIAKDTGYIVMINNPIGYHIEGVREKGIGPIRGAQTPPVHCMPTFIDGKKHHDFLEDIWKNGLEGELGDMSTMFRVIFERNLWDNLFRLPNALWIQTWWYHDMIGKKMNTLYCANERMNMVHGRWWIASVGRQAEDIKEKNLIGFGRNNVRLFFEFYQKFNTQHKIKIDFPFKIYDKS